MTETFTRGQAIDYAMEGYKSLSRNQKKDVQAGVRDRYDTSIDEDTGNLLKRLHKSADAEEFVEAIRNLGGTDAVDDLQMLDKSLSCGYCDPSYSAARASNKANRSTIHVAELINKTQPDGQVYMVKTTSGAFTTKCRIAWDLNENNQVVVVDEYDQWENAFGWEKLKNFPHGRKSIREELGDELSGDLLEEIAPKKKQQSSKDSGKKRSVPSNVEEKELNVSRGSRQRKRSKFKAGEIREAFEDGDTLGGHQKVSVLVLFPSTCDKNMTDNWWVAGSDKGTRVAIAACNKGTYEYLSDLDQVYHIEEYIDQASEYEFNTSEGVKTFPDDDEKTSYVFHVLSDEMADRMLEETAIKGMRQALEPYLEKHLWSAPEGIPDPDEMVYCPITRGDCVWLRPMLREVTSLEADPMIVVGSCSSRDLGKTYSVSGGYKLYARARLPDWDFESTEMELLDNASYKLDLDDGGYELIETLAQLHDQGEVPYSERPERRWEK